MVDKLFSSVPWSLLQNRFLVMPMLTPGTLDWSCNNLCFFIRRPRSELARLKRKLYLKIYAINNYFFRELSSLRRNLRVGHNCQSRSKGERLLLNPSIFWTQQTTRGLQSLPKYLSSYFRQSAERNLQQPS